MRAHLQEKSRVQNAQAKAKDAEWKPEFLDAYQAETLASMGSAIHEHGTCRMGDDPKRSALSAFNQMHEVKNVFVVDGSAFPNSSEKNPTLSIVALSWRATDYLAEQLRDGTL